MPGRRSPRAGGRATVSQWLLDIWSHWPIQTLVLLSMAIQVFLFVFSGTRRRGANPVMRFMLWMAYLMADSTALYALGHLSLTSKAAAPPPEEQRLVAFWSSFLLLHLGGPDSMTAYALQDNQLWLRHLHTLVVQVLGAAYVLYKLIAGGGGTPFVVLAAILMFAVGVVKFGERTWALRCSNLSSIRSSIRKESQDEKKHRHRQFSADLKHRRVSSSSCRDTTDEELNLRRAHSLFHICKRAVVDSSAEKEDSGSNGAAEMLTAVAGKNSRWHTMWILMEVELSLLYDILYTKAAVIHNLRGYCIRVVSPLATVASFLLFHLSGDDKHGDTRVDVAVTYALLAGAFLLEMASLLSALGSSWTYSFLCTTRWTWLRHTVLCAGRWDRIRRLVDTIATRLGGGGKARRWSGKIGQYNMLHLCSRRETLLGRLAELVGLKEWWNTMYYSGSVQISDQLREELFDYIKQLFCKKRLNTQGVIRGTWGEETLKALELYDDDLQEIHLGVEFQESIIIWHIATDIFLANRKVYGSAKLVESVRTLSNYMMFLLVECPDMLPGLAQTRLYHRTCQNLVAEWRKKHEQDKSHDDPNDDDRDISSMFKEFFCLCDDPATTRRLEQRQKFATYILNNQDIAYRVDVPRLPYAKLFAQKLLKKEEQTGSKVLEGILKVLMDFLVYAANRCSRESHAKRLSRGSELTTVLWLMADYLHQDFLNTYKPSTKDAMVSAFK